ncbi:hypothetical protein E2562_020316 [Oryza meyeriana var. granulata]|uniref:DUF4378 domain-containing protein n=1 Tax=Oryza meyeriana var. granulata TaxID=110450 RepID=A0A6G1EBL7_9ORYZ|nr:hypothetical protein E2562_020316 [Oryza meyeriana var. granulata]KAF0921854.1 hypothetical protein E2562_020316 [Oryza meyeriana var. granulata]
MATMAGGSKPLRLKDLLELDCESCSAAGFRCYPRRLCVAGAAVATASSSPMQRPKLSSLSKSLSHRLRRGFWRRREEEEEEEEASPASFTAPAVNSCCCSSDSETSESSNSTGRKSHSQSESEFSSASSDSLHAGEPSTTGAEHEVMKRESKEEEEADDKEQLSPVGVMDFPSFGEDDEIGVEDADAVEEEERVAGAGACSPSFSDSLAQLQLQRRKMKLQPKIRRLGRELRGVDLEARFAASESDHLAGVIPVQIHCSTDVAPPRHDDHRSDGVLRKYPDEYSLLDLLVDTVSIGVVDDVTKRLLLDFFVEAKCNSTRIELHTSTNLSHEGRRQENGETLRLAKAWLEGRGTMWSLNDVVYHGEAVMAEMERSRRWMHTGEEERETSVVVAAMVIDELLYELVSDLIA